MSVEIRMLTLGVAATNCYIVGDTESKAAIVIDPVDRAPLLFQTAQDVGWTIRLIVATHGHYDHVLACRELKELTGAPFYIHHNNPQLNGKSNFIVEQIFPALPQPDRLLSDESETLEVEQLQLKTLYTPGHAPDHVCFYMPQQNILFGGDCLFAGSIGRTDLPFSDHDTLMDSIFTKMLALDDSVHVLPGHMQATTIGRERQTNPFLLEYQRSQRANG